MAKKMVDLHVMVDKEDIQLLSAFCTNHGDMSKIIRRMVKSFCDEIKDGDKSIIPDELLPEIEEYQKQKAAARLVREREELNDEISG